MAVTITRTRERLYMWNQVTDKTWGQSTLQWGDYGPTDYALVADIAIGLAEKLGKVNMKKAKERFSSVDKVDKSVDIKRTDAFHIARTYWDNISFLLKIVESFKVRDKAKKSLEQVRGEIIALLSKANSVFSLGFDEKIRLLDGQSKKHIARRTLRENASLRGTHRWLMATRPRERLVLTDKTRQGMRKLVYDNITPRDTAFSPNFLKNLGDSLMIKGKESNGFGGLLRDTFTLQDFLKESFTKESAESVSLVDAIGSFELVKKLAEMIKAKDKPLKNFERTRREWFALARKANRNIKHNTTESVTIEEEYNRFCILLRSFAEGLDILDKRVVEASMKQEEAIALRDALMQACRAVLSNIYIEGGEMTEADFMRMVNSPAGYTEFSELKVGEYEYEEALIRLIVQSGQQQTQPTVNNVVVHVDIPDTDDRGTAVINNTDGPTEIQFNKHYYTVPEVSVALRGASFANGFVYPNITNITTTGFNVELIGEGGRVTGTVSWVAKGY